MIKLLYFDRPVWHDERIWLAYKDVCGENMERFKKLVDDVKHGTVSEKQLEKAMLNRGEGLEEYR